MMTLEICSWLGNCARDDSDHMRQVRATNMLIKSLETENYATSLVTENIVLALGVRHGYTPLTL